MLFLAVLALGLLALLALGLGGMRWWRRDHHYGELQISLLERGSALSEAERTSVNSPKETHQEVLVTDHATVVMHEDEITVQQVNQYRLGDLLGSGSFSQVYAGSTGNDVFALKVMRRKTLNRSKVLGRPPPPKGRAVAPKRDLVRTEIAVMKKLRHPNVVQLFEVIDDPSAPCIYLVLEMVSGGTLAQPIERKRHVPDAELRHWLRGLVLGLEHLHVHGVVHRDVKPENILWCARTEQPKLTDFGVSTDFDAHRLGGDYVHATGGTFAFFAPEMCASKMPEGFSARAADWWALGVCLYMWLYHAPLYDAANAPLLLQQIATQEPVFPEETGARDPALYTLLRGLLQRKPARRYKVLDLRRDPFLTASGVEPLPSRPKWSASNDLQLAIKTVVHADRLSRSSISHREEEGSDASPSGDESRDASPSPIRA